MNMPEGPGIPSEQRRKKGPVACIECFQHIPCDPCQYACPHGAIRVGDDITSLPSLDGEKCVGCGLCVAKCPGLAIFLVDDSVPGFSRVTFPWEYLPLPEEGDDVACTDREGRIVSRGTVVRVVKAASFDGTAAVTVQAPEGTSMQIRSLDRKSYRKEAIANGRT